MEIFVKIDASSLSMTELQFERLGRCDFEDILQLDPVRCYSAAVVETRERP